VDQNVNILGRRLYSPSLKDVAWLEDAQLTFLIFIHLLTIFLPSQILQMYGKLEKLTERLLAKLHPSDLVKTIFYLVF